MRSKKDRIRSAVALSYETARHAVAYEKTRQKPEDASPMAQRPNFRSWLADFASRALARFLKFFGYSRPITHKEAVKRHKQTTPPRAFGKAGRKLARRMARRNAA